MSEVKEERETRIGNETEEDILYVTGRHAARFAAVQALYQLLQDKTLPADAVLVEFLYHRLNEDMCGFALRNMDRAFFSDLVRGIKSNESDIDYILAGVLPEDWQVSRLDSVLRALLQAGIYELAYRDDVPPRVSIDQYINISKLFFFGREPKLANGVLHKVASEIRPEDLDAV